MPKFFHRSVVTIVAFSLVWLMSATSPAGASDGKIHITWLGHAAFKVVSPGGTTLLLDPFITNNPKTPEKFKDLSQYKPDAILLTHSHGDHVGKFKIGDVTVHFVPAMHSSTPGGRPLGYIIEFDDGRSIYDTGDTWIFGDMALIQEIYSPNIILLQAGGGPYNQDPKTAALAIKKFFTPDAVIPMHYGTWPILSGEDEVKAMLSGTAGIKFMQPGDSASF